MGSLSTTAVPCDCGCSVFLVTQFEQYGPEPEQIYIEVLQSFISNKLRSRMRAAWRVIQGKDPWLHAIVLTGNDIATLRKAVNKKGEEIK